MMTFVNCPVAAPVKVPERFCVPPLNVTVPVPELKTFELAQSPPTEMDEEPAFNVPAAEIVTFPETLVVAAAV